MGPALRELLDFYLSQSLSIIPVGYDKKPLVKWEQFKECRASREEVYGWYSKGGLNVAVVCGRVSDGLVIIDFEREEDFRRMFSADIASHTFVVKTPHGGVHVWLKEGRLERIPRRTIRVSEDHPIDILGENGYAVAPPSKVNHSLCDRSKCRLSGLGFYEPIGVMDIMVVEDVYDSLVQMVEKLGWRVKPKHRFKLEDVLSGVEKGRRNVSAFRYARYLMFTVGLDAETAWYELKRWNSMNKPPLDEDELKTVWKSAQNYIFTDLKKRRVRL